MRIAKLETEHLRIPLPRPVTMPGGQDAHSAKELDVVLVHLHTDSKLSGLGFIHSFRDASLFTSIINDQIAPILLKEDPARIEWLFAKAQHELTPLGFQGVVARAYAAVDFALWDLKGKTANLPVHALLGGFRTKLKAIAADTATPALGVKQAVRETRSAFDRGAAGVQIEIGTQDPDVDIDRLRQLLEGLPEGPWIEVNAAHRYDTASALWMGRAFENEFGIDSYLDALPANDTEGYARLSDRLDLSLGAGGSFDDCLRLLNGPGLSTLRLDLQALGGLTPARKLAAAAELKQIAISPVRCQKIGAHLSASVVYGRVCETVDWFDELFHGGPRFENNQLIVPDTPGFGLVLHPHFAAKHRV